MIAALLAALSRARAEEMGSEGLILGTGSWPMGTSVLDVSQLW